MASKAKKHVNEPKLQIKAATDPKVAVSLAARRLFHPKMKAGLLLGD